MFNLYDVATEDKNSEVTKMLLVFKSNTFRLKHCG